MQQIPVNTIRKITAVISVFAVLVLNFSAVIQCGAMLFEKDCCHITNTVKPCCLKSYKITFEERIAGHCGCSIKESQTPADLYNDLLAGQNKSYSKTQIDSEAVSADLLQGADISFTENYSPPEISKTNTYLCNMNLRI